MAAAIQLGKGLMDPTVYERGRVGGLLWYANRVDNMLGHRGENGRALCKRFSDHISDLNIKVVAGEVTSVGVSGGGFDVVADRRSHYRYLIVATGTRPRKVELEGVLYYIEEPASFKGSSVLVIGGGDLALDNSLRLKGEGARPVIVHRGLIRANRMLQGEVMEANIPMLVGDTKDVEKVKGGYLFNGERFDHAVAYIGRESELSLLEGIDYGSVDLPTGETDIEGLYIVGDAVLGRFGQATLAAGTGLAAAMHICSR